MAPNSNFHRLDSLAGPPPMQDGNISYPNPNVQGNPYIYLAVYSSVPVYEMMVRGIGVMRRRSDSFLNATQILKVAGVEKGKRTKILEKDIAMGVHEKVQGGYGRYQGTWIPFERAVELANAFNVSHLLSPLFDYTPPPPPVSLGGANVPIVNRYGGDSSPPQQQQQQQQQQHIGGGQSAADVLSKAREQGLLPDVGVGQGVEGSGGRKRSRDSGGQEDYKRPRMDTNGNGFGPVAGPSQNDGNGDASSTALRRSNKIPATSASSMDPAQLEQTKSALKSIFSLSTSSSPSSAHNQTLDLSASLSPSMDPDTPIDENLHTALHWAAALARISIVKALVAYGADMYRGNNVGETPLIRAVLVTNNSDQDSFPRLLEVLGPSLRTVDDSGRTVLHHAALVAGVKGRAASARYYLGAVLEYVARVEGLTPGSGFRDLVDAQDEKGDTALNIAARIGNKALVSMLLEVGADKEKGNRIGLRPGDFGLEVEGLPLSPTVAGQAPDERPPPPVPSFPLSHSSTVLTSLHQSLTSLSSSFSSSLSAKSAQLTSLHATIRSSTAHLASLRLALSNSRAKLAQVQAAEQRIHNLQLAIVEEDSFDWTGRTEIDGSPAIQPAAGAGFIYRGPGSTLSNLPTGINIEFDADPLGPTEGAENALVHLIRLKGWYERVLGLLDQRVTRREGGEAEKEARLRKVVARCCGVKEGEVDGLLEGLVAALESDGTGLEMTRVAAFLSRVKDGSLQ